MLAYPVILISRMDPFKYLFEKLALTSRISRWMLTFAEFDLKYVTSKLVKRRIVAEHLAELPVEFMKGEEFLFPDKEIMRIEQSL